MIRKSYKKFMQSTYKKLHKEVSNKNYLWLKILAEEAEIAYEREIEKFKQNEVS